MSKHSTIFEDELTLSCALFATGIIVHLVRDKCRQNKDAAAAAMTSDQAAKGDSYFQVRYQTTLQQDQRRNLTVHRGQCHCSKVQFKILAPRVLYAVDVPSKIRFPRVTVHYHDFELIETDISVLSMYTVQQSESNSLGIHSFCSYCGMQILYAPSIDPIEVQINLDCLEAGTIEASHIAYHSSVETVPHPLEGEEEGDHRGSGHNPVLAEQLLPELSSHSPVLCAIKPETSSAKTVSEASTEVLYASTAKEINARHHSAFTTPSARQYFPSEQKIMMMQSNHPTDQGEGLLDNADSVSVMSMDSSFEPPVPRPHSSISFMTMTSTTIEGESQRSRTSSYQNHQNAEGGQASGSAQSSPSSTASSSRKRYSQIHSSSVDYNTYQQMKKYLYRHLEPEQKEKSEQQQRRKKGEQTASGMVEVYSEIRETSAM